MRRDQAFRDRGVHPRRIVARPPRAALVLVSGLLVTGPSTADAGELDLEPARLRIPASDGPGAVCPTRDPGDDPSGPPRDYCPDDAAWARLVTQLSFSVAPLLDHPADTGGMRGFAAELSIGLSGIDSGSPSFTQGTSGANPGDPTARNEDVPAVLTAPRLVLRKGLPMGVRLDAEVGVIARSSMWTMTGRLVWAIFEAVDPADVPLPDIAVTGAVTGLLASPDLQLTIGSVGFIVSEPVVAGRARVVVTPFAGTELLIVRGRSGVVDLTPDVDGLSECVPDPREPGVACSLDPDTELPGGRVVGQDLRNDARFAPLDALRWRVAGGLRVGWDALVVRVAVGVDALAPSDLGPSDDLRGLPRQWGVSVGLGGRYR